MGTIYYYRIRQYDAGDEPYNPEDSEVVEEGRKTVGGSTLEECLDRFQTYRNNGNDCAYSIEIIDTMGVG